MGSFADHFSALAARYAAYRPHYPPELVGILADRCEHHAAAWEPNCELVWARCHISASDNFDSFGM